MPSFKLNIQGISSEAYIIDELKNDAVYLRMKFGIVGRLAQLVEYLVYTEIVGSSNLSSPTIKTSDILLQFFCQTMAFFHLL